MERFLITIKDRENGETKTMEGELVSIVSGKSSHSVSCALIGRASLVACSELYAGLKDVMSSLEGHAKRMMDKAGLGERKDVVKMLLDGLSEIVEHD